MELRGHVPAGKVARLVRARQGADMTLDIELDKPGEPHWLSKSALAPRAQVLIVRKVGPASVSARPTGAPAPSPRREVACPAPRCSSRPGRWCASWRLDCPRRRRPPSANTRPPTPAGSTGPSPTRRGGRSPCWRPGSPTAGRRARSPRARSGVDRADGAPGRLGRARVPPRAGLDSPGGCQGSGRGSAHGALPPQPAAPRRPASPGVGRDRRSMEFRKTASRFSTSSRTLS